MEGSLSRMWPIYRDILSRINETALDSIQEQSKAFSCFDCHWEWPMRTNGPWGVIFVFMADMHVEYAVDNILILMDFEVAPKKFSLQDNVSFSVVQ